MAATGVPILWKPMIIILMATGYSSSDNVNYHGGSDVWAIKFNVENLIQVLIFDIQGNKIHDTTNNYVDIEGFASGLYLAKIFTNKEIITKKLAIK